MPGMVCLACSQLAGGALCRRCELSLRRCPDFCLAGVGAVRSAFRHRGAARLLVHHLKYGGIVAAGALLAEAMAHHVPPGTVLVPVPRVGWRRLRYGVDPALELTRSLARITDAPVARPLVAPFLGRARAGGVHGSSPRFRLGRPVPRLPVMLVDDVITTGSTLIEAARLFPLVQGALTATSSTGTSPTRERGAEVTSVADGGHQTE